MDAPERCPNCGSANVVLMKKEYNSGCGCLGLLLFGWWGLLLGLLGMDEYEMVCQHCGSRWPVGKPHRATRGGCGCLSAALLLIIMLMAIAAVISAAA